MINHTLYKIFLFSAMSLFTINVYAEHSWSTYHWARTANPFTLLVVDSVTGDWVTELNETLSEWSASHALNLEVTRTDGSRKARARCKMVSGQIRVCNDRYGNNGWLGLASIGIDSNGHIDRGTAKLNDTYSAYWADPAEKNHVMCQEIGHLFGLGHTTEDGSSQGTCMDYSSDPNSQWPNEHDYQLLAEIYSTTDSYDSYDTGTSPPPDDGGKGCNSPPGKGCNKKGFGSNRLAGIPPMGIRVSGNRFEEVWVSPRNDGGLWIHHIRLAP